MQGLPNYFRGAMAGSWYGGKMDMPIQPHPVDNGEVDEDMSIDIRDV